MPALKRRMSQGRSSIATPGRYEKAIFGDARDAAGCRIYIDVTLSGGL